MPLWPAAGCTIAWLGEMANGVGQGVAANAGVTQTMPARVNPDRLNVRLQAWASIWMESEKIDICIAQTCD
jgi:hypothetical protein